MLHRRGLGWLGLLAERSVFELLGPRERTIVLVCGVYRGSTCLPWCMSAFNRVLKIPSSGNFGV